MVVMSVNVMVVKLVVLLDHHLVGMLVIVTALNSVVVLVLDLVVYSVVL